MATTSPDNLYSPDSGDGYDLVADWATSMDSVQDAFIARALYRTGTNADRIAATPVEGMRWQTTDTDILWLYQGGAWKAWESDWITYTATLTNFAVGTLPSGTPKAVTRYKYAGGRVRVTYAFVFGSNGTAPNSPRFSVPVTAAALDNPFQLKGLGSLWDASAVQVWVSALLFVNTTTVQLQYNVSPVNDVSPGGPFTWASGDAMTGEFEYDPA